MRFQKARYAKKASAPSVASYKRSRKKLIADMGGCCVKCGATESLEFHHKFKRTWKAAETSRWVRIARYRREWVRGILELLCGKCNKEAGEPTEYEPGVTPPKQDDFIPE